MVPLPGGYLAWLSDSRRVLYGRPGLLAIADTVTHRSHPVVSMPGGLNLIQGFAISPDNRTIYYSLQSSESDIWLMSLK